MFCPKCKCEYRGGFDECSDCLVPLVAELPDEALPVSQAPKEPLRDFKFVTLKETCNPAVISYLQSIFKAEGIPFHISGGFMGSAGVPYKGYTSRILVADYAYDRAVEIIDDLGK